ncbi:MAG: hypothetical protein DMG10_21505 [Acidobacteria bacterium]|nr:MAG: hypothetical protein DMG10_21505 [Acidobacteriota bacterium]
MFSTRTAARSSQRYSGSSPLWTRLLCGFRFAGGGTSIQHPCWRPEDCRRPCARLSIRAGQFFRSCSSISCAGVSSSKRRGRRWSGCSGVRTWFPKRSARIMEKINPMNYLFAAYVAIWIILALYLYSIHSREQSLREEVRRLRDLLEKKSRQ